MEFNYQKIVEMWICFLTGGTPEKAPRDKYLQKELNAVYL